MMRIAKKHRIRVGALTVTLLFLLSGFLLQPLVPLTRAKSIPTTGALVTPSKSILFATGQNGGSPSASLLAPVGGEILDAGSSFNIVWSVDDPTGSITGFTLEQSTNGGSSFTTIANIPASETSYPWTVPSIANNTTVQLELVANCQCNGAPILRTGNFTIFNPGHTFGHLAEAPFFVSGPADSSIIYLTNASANSVTVELDPHQPLGNATQKLPTQLTLAAGASSTVDAASLYSIGTDPHSSSFQATIQGAIRLRHNGTQDSDIHGYIVAQNNGERFTTPFTYPASAQSASGSSYCSPMYYTDSNTDSYVAFQNATNSQQFVALTCNYGTGASGTPNGQFASPQTLVLGPQQTKIINLARVASAFDGTNWGSMDVAVSAPQSVVCHSVMMSSEDGVAWDCPFVDPAMSVSTTKVAGTVTLDYNSGENAYIMLCNMATASRSVTASFNTSNGVSIPPVEVTVPAGGQQMITLNAQQLLSSGQSTTADVRLSCNGAAQDIQAAGCSLSLTGSRATPIKFREPSSAYGKRLTSPYFRSDEATSGMIEISNLGSTTVTAGAKMVFANSTATPLKTSIVSVPAGGYATIDLSSVAIGVPDGVASVGRVDLIHNAAPGTVLASVSTTGYTDNSGHVVPLDPGPPPDPITLFPPSPMTQTSTGGCIDLDAITDGSVPSPSAISTSSCFQGPVALGPTGAPDVFHVNICGAVSTCAPQIFPIIIDTGGSGGAPDGGDESAISEESVNFAGFSTGLPNNRLEPAGGTSFTLTAKGALPGSSSSPATLQVDFMDAQGDAVSAQVPSTGISSVSGSGPVNHDFLGAVKKIQLYPTVNGVEDTSHGPLVVAKRTGAYFALDKPTSISANITPSTTIPVTGETITIPGGGFQTWTLQTLQGTVQVNPTVFIGQTNNHEQIKFQVLGVTINPDGTSSITGNVEPVPDRVRVCAQEHRTPCKTVTVINPGGSDGVDDLTFGPIITISAGPQPQLTGTVNPLGGPSESNSTGTKTIAIINGQVIVTPQPAHLIGSNLSRVRQLSFGGAVITDYTIASDTEIDITSVPSFGLSSGEMNAEVNAIVSDNVNPPFTLTNAWKYDATPPITITDVTKLGGPDAIGFIVGPPAESVSLTYGLAQIGGQQTQHPFTNCNLTTAQTCLDVTPNPMNPFVVSVIPGAQLFIFRWSTFCDSSVHQCGTVGGSFDVTATNTIASGITPVTTCAFTSMHACL